MADLFGLLGESAEPSSLAACASVQDVETRMRDLMAGKVSDMRADRISHTFEISSSARFSVAVTEAENEALDALTTIAPSLGGATIGPVQHIDGQMVRTINASDTIMNQPQNDPVLQRSVAKHIISSLSNCDNSTWAVREVSRGSHGWTFTYQCKDSMAAWNRANAKIEKPVIGDYSLRVLDEAIASRPAFDCGGVVTIAFSRSSRFISATYEHIPLHKTVAQLKEFFKPPPPVRPELPAETPKKSKASKKREAPADGPEGSSRKKARTKKNKNGENIAPEAPMTAGADGDADISILAVAVSSGDPSGLGDGQGEASGSTEQPKPKKKRAPRPRKPKAKPTENGEASMAADQSTAPEGVHANSIVNLDPAEAARRREMALQLLTEANVDPSTLSPEQFNIFANQSPTLQKESLAMLVEHGAEKLRIVHPNRDGGTPAPASSPSAMAASVSEASTPKKKSSSRKKKKKSDVPADGDATTTDGATAEPMPKAPKQKLTRGPCNQCKDRKLIAKCNRSKPTCGLCAEADMTCVYAVAMSRKKKSDAIVIENDEDVSEPNVQQQQEEREPSTLPSPGFSTDPTAEADSYAHMDDSMHINEPSDYFQSSHGLALPELAPVPITLSFPENHNHQVGDTLSNPGYALSNPTPQPKQASAYPPPAAPAPDPAPAPESPKSTKSGHRRSTNESRHANVSPVPAPARQPAPTQPTTASRIAESNSGTAQQSPVPVPSNSTRNSSQATAHQPSPTLQSVHRPSPQYQHAAMQNTRSARPRHTNKSQSRTPAPEQQSIGQAPRSSTPQTNHTHLRAPNTQQQSSSTGYDGAADLSGLSSFGYGNYGSNHQTDQSSSRISYQPYQEQEPASNAQSSNYGSYNYNPSASKIMSLARAVSEPTPPNYPTSTSSANQWPNSETRNTTSYSSNNNTSSTPTTSSYSYPSLTQTTSQAHGRTRSSGTPQARQAYAPPLPPPPQQQQQQQQQTIQPQQYGSYSNAQAQNPGQKDWNYGFSSTGGFTAANAPSSTPSTSNNYRPTRNNPGGYGSGSYQQHGGHGYGGHEDAALMDILRGSVPRPG